VELTVARDRCAPNYFLKKAWRVFSIRRIPQPGKQLKSLALLSSFLFVAFTSGSAQSISVPDDPGSTAHCDYVIEQSVAKRDTLRTPKAMVGITQPETGLAEQMIVGVSQSVADIKRANIAMSLGRTNCNAYSADQEARKKLIFLLPATQQHVLENRLVLIQDAISKLNQMVAQNMKRVGAQNMTLPEVYPLQSAVLRLTSDRTSTLSGITSPYVPPQNPTPLKDLITQKRTTDHANQVNLVSMQKQDTWDVALSVGVHQELGPNSTPGITATGPYGSVNVTYNLGRSSINRHVDRSITKYDRWQESEFDDVEHQAGILKLQFEQIVAIQASQLDALNIQSAEVSRNLQALEGVDTDAAMAFRNQLNADGIVLHVDIDDVTFRIQTMKNLLAANF
jgi:hypothetical protein